MQLKLVILIIISSISMYSCLKCNSVQLEIPNTWRDMSKKCIMAVRNQIQKQVDVSSVYLAMGCYFARDTVNRSGLSKQFFAASTEARENAEHLIEQLLKRGELSGDIWNLIKLPSAHPKVEWDSGVDAINDALELETTITKGIKDDMKICDQEKPSNDNIVRFLSDDFLKRQYTKQHKLAGQLSTLLKMMDTNGGIGEFLYDKELLE